MTLIEGTVTVGSTVYPLTGQVTLPPARLPLGVRYNAPGASTLRADWVALIGLLGGAVPDATLDYIGNGPWPAKWSPFYADALPSTLVRLSANNLTGDPQAYLDSVPPAARSLLRVVLRHEVERPTEPYGGTDSARWLRDFTVFRDTLKGYAPWLRVGYAGSGFHYRTAQPGYRGHGEWFPPDADFFSLDIYRTGEPGSTVGPVGTLAEYQSWDRQRREVDPGREWWIGEYGRVLASVTTPGAAQLRLDTLASDLVYLQVAGAACLILFASEGPESTAANPRDWLPAAADRGEWFAAVATHLRG